MGAIHQFRDKTNPHPNRKYTADDVRRWREMMRNEGLSQTAIAEREGINRKMVNRLFQEF